MNSRLLRLSLIAFVITSLAAHGSVTPPPYSPEPDSNNPTFRAEEVTMVDTGAVTLAGTLLTPLEETPVPAVIIIPGSRRSKLGRRPKCAN